MLVIQLFWHSEHAYTPKLPADGKEKNTGNRTLADWYMCTCTRKIEIKYSLSMRHVGIKYMSVIGLVTSSLEYSTYIKLCNIREYMVRQEYRDHEYIWYGLEYR